MLLIRSLIVIALIMSTGIVVLSVPVPSKAPVFQSSGYNVALASNGATVTVSSTVNSNYPASAAINGDRKGLNWGAGGGWNDGTSGQFPDWIEVSFGVNRTIQEIDVFTLQDNPNSPVEPTETMTFSNYGITDFSVQYWDGTSWQSVPGGDVTGNNKVWRKFTFSLINTSKIRVYVTNALSSYSRVTEVETYTPSHPPTVSITSPSNGASFTAPASITINSTATDNDGTISKVEFFQASTKLGEATASPYNFSWTGVAAGSYSLTAKATDDSGAYTISSAVGVTVNPVLATVSGKVTQFGSGSAIAGAIVKALQGTTVAGSATTNSIGDYSISGLLPATYSVEASATGYATQTQTGIVLGNGATVTVNFTLGSAISYVYDELGRLIGVIDQNGQAATYSYDAVGNLLGISRYTPSSLSVIGFTPGIGAAGTSVTIYGAGFNTTANQNAVTFNGTAATVVSATANEIVTSVPAGASTGTIAVNNGTGSTTSSAQFVVETNGAPSISSFSPTVVTPGTPITISGSNFATSTGSNNVTFNVVSSAVSSATMTSLTANTPTAGSGKLKVTTPAGTATGSNDLYIVPPPNNASSVDYTGRMAIGESKTLTIGTAEKIGLMLFEGTAGQKILVQLSNFTVGFALVRIYQPQGVEIAGANGNLVNWVFDAMTLPVTGTYSILVDPDSSFTGSVTFTIFEVPSDLGGTISIGGSPVTVTTTVPGQNAVLSFSGTAGQQVSLATSNATASGTATIRNTYGTALDSSASAPFNGFVETHTLPVTGTHSVLVDPSGSSTGSVTVRLYDTADAVSPITIAGSSITATVSSPGQVAKLPFGGTAGQKVSVKMTNLTFGLGAIRLLKPDGSSLHSVSGVLVTDQFFDQTTLPVNGTYTLLLDPENTQTGSATFQVYDVTTDAIATATIGGSAATLTITAPGQNGEVTFDAAASQQVTVHITGNSVGAIAVTLLKPDGTTVTSSTSSGSFDLATQTLPVTGTYKIRVDPSGAATGGVNVGVSGP